MQSEHPPGPGNSGSKPTNGVRTLLDDTGIRRALMRIAHEIFERND